MLRSGRSPRGLTSGRVPALLWILCRPGPLGLLGPRGPSRLALLLAPHGLAVVGPDDRRHQRVSHDVDVREVTELDARDAAEQALRLEQAARRPRRQVDLRDVPGDDR